MTIRREEALPEAYLCCRCPRFYDARNCLRPLPVINLLEVFYISYPTLLGRAYHTCRRHGKETFHILVDIDDDPLDSHLHNGRLAVMLGSFRVEKDWTAQACRRHGKETFHILVDNDDDPLDSHLHNGRLAGMLGSVFIVDDIFIPHDFKRHGIEQVHFFVDLVDDFDPLMVYTRWNITLRQLR
ncbi:hypothetical protein J6590_047421 [Homalodisca vitripennis]|nr:hypothetical protein J6590_047421 [Homalodisca vitripennis]